MALIRTSGDSAKNITVEQKSVRASQYIDDAIVGDIYIIGLSTAPASGYPVGATVLSSPSTGSGSWVLEATATSISLNNSIGSNYCLHLSGDLDALTF